MTRPIMDRCYIEITNACNLKCAFCPSPSLQSSRSFMEPELFAQLIPQVKPWVKECYLHLLGEPLLHPKLEEILSLAKDHELPISITSNGTLIQRCAELLLSPNSLRQINFSLQALDEIPSDRALEAFEQILYFCQKALELKPELYINLRLWNHTAQGPLSELNQIFIQRIAQLWPTPIVLNPQAQGRKSQKLIGRLYLQFDTRFEWPGHSQEQAKNQGTCHGLRNHFGIRVDGTVVPCCLDAEGALQLGNITEQSLWECLDSPRAKWIREGFENFELRESHCQKCPYSRRFKPKSARPKSKQN